MFKGRKLYVNETGIMELKLVEATPVEFEDKLAFSSSFITKDNKHLNVLIFDNYYSAKLLDTLEQNQGKFIELAVTQNDKGYLSVELIKDLV